MSAGRSSLERWSDRIVPSDIFFPRPSCGCGGTDPRSLIAGTPPTMMPATARDEVDELASFKGSFCDTGPVFAIFVALARCIGRTVLLPPLPLPVKFIQLAELLRGMGLTSVGRTPVSVDRNAGGARSAIDATDGAAESYTRPDSFAAICCGDSERSRFKVPKGLRFNCCLSPTAICAALFCSPNKSICLCNTSRCLCNSSF